jgi:hypothetical protein
MYYQNPYWYWTDAVDDKWIKKIQIGILNGLEWKQFNTLNMD